MAYFHLPDKTILHGVDENPNGFSYGEARALIDDDKKIDTLEKRLEGYYFSGLEKTEHPFIFCIAICIGIEVLGQVILGFKPNGDSEEENTIKIYKMLDDKINDPPNDIFQENYIRNKRAHPFPTSFTSYAHVIKSGLRNSFIHNYRSLGVTLGTHSNDIIEVDESEGIIRINPKVFREKFISLYKDIFQQIKSGSNENYRANALKYFNFLINGST